MKNKKTLSILISTFNRASLLGENVRKLLQYPNDDIEIIVCDNCSSDETVKILSCFSDDRLKVYRNEKNLGFNNCFTIIKHASSKFFMFLNDRDYIDVNDLEEMTSFANSVDYDIVISSKWERYHVDGERIGKKLFKFMQQADHPGKILYNLDFVRSFVDVDELSDLVSSGDNVLSAPTYFKTRIYRNVRKGFYCQKERITQPKNRDRLSQNRKEVFASTYVLPQFHISYFNHYLSYYEKYGYVSLDSAFLLASFEVSLWRIEWQFYNSVKSKDFRLRNNCEDCKPRDWIKNGTSYFRCILRVSCNHPTMIHRCNLGWVYLRVTLTTLLKICLYYFRWPFSKMLDIFREKKK